MASPAFVALSSAFTLSGGAVAPTDPGGGNFLLALGVTDPGATLSTPSGWTQFASLGAGDHKVYLWTAPRGTPAFSWNASAGAYAEVHVASYSGVYTTTPIDPGCTSANCFGTPASATSYTPPAITSQTVETLSIAIATNYTAGWSTAAAPSTYTARIPGGGTTYSAAGGDKAIAAAGAIAPGAIALGAGASNGVGIHVVLASAAAGGGGGGGGGTQDALFFAAA